MTHVEMAGKTDPGCVRATNEDSLALDQTLGLLVVADGMGGHNSGEVASALATETILEYARKMLGSAKSAPAGGARRSAHAKALEDFISAANTIIYEKSRVFPKDHGMGTTVVVALLGEGIVTVAHVGDSRMYLMREGRLQLLTQDHSLVMDQVRHGLITAEEAGKSTLQNILTRALGPEERVVADIEEHPVFPGDVLLLCSDGLTKMVSEPYILAALKDMTSPAQAADVLIEAARKAGGIDNVTVAVARLKVGKRNGWRSWLPKCFRG